MQHALGEMILDGSVKDPRLGEASMVTITDVEMSPDLKLARVHVSVYPEDEAVVARVFEGLSAAAPQLKRELADRLRLRFTPELLFSRDDSIARGMRIDSLLKEIAAKGEGGEGGG